MEWTSIKDYAKAHGISIQAVYQQINRKKNKEFLEQHIAEIHGVKFLDEDAVNYLEERRQNTPSIILSENKDEIIEELENKLQKAQQMVVELQNKIIESRDREIEYIRKLNDSLELYNLALEDKTTLSEEIKNVNDKLEKAEVEILEKNAVCQQLEQKLTKVEEIVIEKNKEIEDITNSNMDLLDKNAKIMNRSLWERIRNKAID